MEGIIEWFKSMLTDPGASAQLLTLIITAIGGIFALFQWRMSVKNSQAEYVDNLLQRTQNDKNIKEFIDACDYEINWYNKNFHDDLESWNPENDETQTPFAIKADKALFFFNYLCYLKERRILGKQEFRVFGYYMLAVMQCKDTQAYFLDLYQFSMVENRAFPYEYMLRYGLKEKIFPAEMVDKNYFKYVFVLESGEKNISESFRAAYEIMDSSRSLYTYSRCLFCKQFNPDKAECKAAERCDEHFWALPQNNCKKFRFDTALWDSNRNTGSYMTVLQNRAYDKFSEREKE